MSTTIITTAFSSGRTSTYEVFGTTQTVGISVNTDQPGPAVTSTITTLTSKSSPSTITPTKAATTTPTPVVISTPSPSPSTPITSATTSFATTTNTSGVAGGQSSKPTSTSSPKVPYNNNPAVIAGCVVGCLIGGALIAGILTWFIMKKTHHRKRHSGGGFASERQRSSRGTTGEKALPIAPIGGAAVVGNWEKHLDQPEGDATITRSVKGVFDHIEVHVENFYRDAQVPISPELQGALMNVDSHHLPDSVAGLLPQSQRPTMLIKHCIAQAIVEHISPESEIRDSFLPADYSALPSILAAKGSDGNKPAFHQAFSRWRVLSAYLRPPPSNDTGYKTQRDAHIASLADLLSRTFAPWAMSHDNFGARRENLANIMRAASESGILLFSQPATFRWRWSISSNSSKNSGRLRIVLLPGLEKVRDEHANELQMPQEMLKPVTGVIIG